MKRNSQSYRNRRIYSAARGGFKRIGVEPTPAKVDSLKVSLGRIWDKGLNKPCPLQCGRILKPRLANFCHNQALASGGKHVASNIFLACSTCNKSQRTLLKSEYLKLRQLVIENLGADKWKKIRSWLAGSRY